MPTVRLTVLLAVLGFACIGLRAADDGAQKPSAADADIIKAQKPAYPLQTCVVSGERLSGDMGVPVDYVYQGRLVRFCCKGCIKDFKKDPAKYLSLIDEAAKKAGTTTKDQAPSAAPKANQNGESRAGAAGGCCK